MYITDQGLSMYLCCARHMSHLSLPFPNVKTRERALSTVMQLQSTKDLVGWENKKGNEVF